MTANTHSPVPYKKSSLRELGLITEIYCLLKVFFSSLQRLKGQPAHPHCSHSTPCNAYKRVITNVTENPEQERWIKIKERWIILNLDSLLFLQLKCSNKKCPEMSSLRLGPTIRLISNSQQTVWKQEWVRAAEDATWGEWEVWRKQRTNQTHDGKWHDLQDDLKRWSIRSATDAN